MRRLPIVSNPAKPILPPMALSSLFSALAPAKLLSRGQALYEAGSIADGCYWLSEGALKVSVLSPRGEERILALIRAGTLVGMSGLIDGLERTSSVHAIKDSGLLFMPRHMFLERLQESPALYSYLLEMMVARRRHSDKEFAAVNFLSLKERIARALLQFAEHLGEPTTTPDQVVIRGLRQEDLAARANAARENVSRLLGQWKKSKVISRPTPSIYVIRKSRIEREAGF